MSALADLSPTDAELADLADVMMDLGDVDGLAELFSEMDGADPGSYLDGYTDPDLQAELDAAEAELANAGYELASLDLSQPLPNLAAADAARYAEDAAGMPWASEDRTAYLLDRIERGTYTPGADLSNASHGCGPLDDFGRCSSRFHDALCFETARGEAATGSAVAIEAWRDTLLSGHQAASAVQLANEQLAGAADAAASQVHDQGTYAAMRGILGLG